MAQLKTLNKPISAEEFFKEYILKRKPVKFSFVLDELKVAADKWKDNDYLINKAGKSMISAEVRKSLHDTFGIATKEKMEFGTFLNLLGQKEEEKYYLTVQEIETNEFGPTLLYASPLKDGLISDIPLKPSLLECLELYQINVWCGHSIKGTSSKLHHDWHDNLYTVIRGKKEFTLFPPKCVHSMYLNGDDKVCNVFDNGLITYDKDFREDGASRISVQKWQNHNEKNTLPSLFADDQIEMDDEEKLLDELLNKKMEQMTNDNDEYPPEDVDDNEDDDFYKLMLHEEEIKEPPLKRQKLSNDATDKKESTSESESDPLSFSLIDLKQSDDEIIQKYPKYANALQLKQVITVNEGEMLYLPAGWFHEVTSSSNLDLKSHFALNYWMHPPLTTGSMQQPYCDSFWKTYNQQTFEH